MDFQQLAIAIEPYTMASEERVKLLIGLANLVLEQDIYGDFVECGVCNGGSAAILAHFAAKANPRRMTWLFDSFEGLPNTTKEDTPSINGNTAESEIGKCVGSIDIVKKVLGLVGADMDRVRITKGWFQDTLPKNQIGKICMLNLDSDWYESEKLCLEILYDKVVSGGFIYFDDFFYWPGCQKAAKEFFRNRNIDTVFHRVGHSAWIVKHEKGFAGPGRWIGE